MWNVSGWYAEALIFGSGSPLSRWLLFTYFHSKCEEYVENYLHIAFYRLYWIAPHPRGFEKFELVMNSTSYLQIWNVISKPGLYRCWLGSDLFIFRYFELDSNTPREQPARRNNHQNNRQRDNEMSRDDDYPIDDYDYDQWRWSLASWPAAQTWLRLVKFYITTMLFTPLENKIISDLSCRESECCKTIGYR